MEPPVLHIPPFPWAGLCYNVGNKAVIAAEEARTDETNTDYFV
jgi:hypothetical protein